jgi:hypothetical protein
MLPTYGRSAADSHLPKFITTALTNVSNLNNIAFTFCVNKRDTATINFINGRLREVAVDFEIIIEELPRPHLAKYFNMMYDQTKFNDESTLVSMLGDDMEFLTDSYDLLILNAANECDGLGLIFGDDCLWWHEQLCVNFFTSRRLVELIKPNPFMCELFPRDQIDIVWRDIAQQLGVYIYISSLKIRHNHSTAPGNTKDATFENLSKEDDAVKANVHLLPDYVLQCIQNVRVNAMTMRFGTDVIMTTYDRIDLLKETVESYCQVPIRPASIHVFDDKSVNAKQIKEICSEMPGMVWHENEANLGCIKNTPAALRWMFEENKSEAVVILDSDIQLDSMWWLKVNKLYNDLKNDPKFGSINMLNLPNNPKGVCSPKHRNILEKPHWGACGALITYDFWKNFITKNEMHPHGLWDNLSSKDCHQSGKKNFVCSPSLIQHTGVTQGTHLGGPGTFALDFRNTKWYGKKHAVDENIPDKSVLFSCQGRYGDIIMDTMIVNMLISKGYRVTFLTIPYYNDMLCYILPDVKRIMKFDHINFKMYEWGDMSTEQLRKHYQGQFRYYINGQPGTNENHDTLLKTGLHMAAFIKARVEDIIDEQLPDNYIDFLPKLPYKHYQVTDLEPGKGLAIIAPEVISTASAFDGAAIDKMFEDLSSEYNVRILTKNRPELPFSQIRGRYIYGLSFNQCIQVLMGAKLFVGNDSGLAWASMFNRDCNKIIYHKVKRLLETNVWYNFIDPKAKDKVVK